MNQDKMLQMNTFAVASAHSLVQVIAVLFGELATVDVFLQLREFCSGL